MKTTVTVKKFPENEWVLWVGAGISCSNPSCLPLGKELTEYILEKTCGKREKKRIIHIWNKISETFPYKNVNVAISSIPRLESILDVVAEVENKIINIDYSFISGFKSFLLAPYNEQHVGLAKLVANGATIITSNFDLCIENAYNDLFAGKEKLIQTSIDSLIIYSSPNPKSSGKIIHFHGTAENVQSMGATLQVIKTGFSPATSNKIIQAIQNSKANIFIGYSFSDAFDVNPFFENIAHGFFCDQTAIFFQHQFDPSLKKNIMPTKIGNLLRCYSHQIYDSGLTNEYIAELVKNHITLSGRFNWQEEFLQETNLKQTNKISPFLTCKIANFLGFGLTRISKTAYFKSLSLEGNYPNNDFHDTLTVSLRRIHLGFLEKYHNSKKQPINGGNRKTTDLLGLYYGQGNYKKAIDFAAPINEIIQEAKSMKSVLNWHYYTSMSVYCRPIIQNYLLSLNSINITNLDKTKIDQYLPMIELLGNRPLQNVISINQCATALRFKLLFLALRDGYDDSKTEKRIFYLYGESSSIEGYISAFRDIAIKNIFLFRIHNDELFRIKAIQFAFSSFRLAFIVGHVSGIIRAAKLVFIIIISVIVKFFNNLMNRFRS